MSKQKAIGYVRSSHRGISSAASQKHAIQSYCEDRGYELISNYETNAPLLPEQIDDLEAYIRDQLGLRDTTVKLIPAAMSRIGRDIGVVQSAIIALHDKCIEVEPVAASEHSLVEQVFNAKHNLLIDFAKIITTTEEAHIRHEINTIAHALQKAYEWDQSEEKFQEILSVIEDNYDPDLTMEENFSEMIVLYSCIQHKLRTAAGRTITQRTNTDSRIYGYMRVDGKLLVDEIEAENVKWMFSMILQYTEHPPVSLVEAVIESAAAQGETITYEDAERRVSYDAILHYMGRELNLKNRIFTDGPEQTLEVLQNILALPIEEAEVRYAEIKEETVSESTAWTCRVRQILPRPSYYSQSPICEPIISAETYAAAQRAMQSKLTI